MAPLEKVNPSSDFALKNAQFWRSVWAFTQKIASEFVAVTLGWLDVGTHK